ncbi:hypothetical protein QFC19_004811 [Naganishia cerealis]|uniref:Uncharacterized protein n=1 Tax=Naganishia cerealis TaxID=610337 RepID=A0ACC2VS55_9TREE|nr:hypothetical protein QFC19_004811 [Naganishia cerealis]
MSVTWPLAKRCHMILRKLSLDDNPNDLESANLSSQGQQQHQTLPNATDDLSAFALLGASLPTIGYSGDSEQDDLLTLLMTNDWSVDNSTRSGDSQMQQNMLGRHSNMMG